MTSYSMMIRLVAVPDCLEAADFDDIFHSVLGWDGGTGYAFRIHGQEFNSFRRRTRAKRLCDFHLHRQEKFFYMLGVQHKAGGQAAFARNCGYQRRNTSSNSSLRTFVRVCNNKCAPSVSSSFAVSLRTAAHHLVDRRFHKRRADRFSLPVSLPEVRDELAVIPDVGFELVDPVANFCRRNRMAWIRVQIHK